MKTGTPIVKPATPLAVTIPTARALSGLGNTTIWGLIGAGTLETVRVGRRRLVLYRSIEKLLSPKAACQAATRHRLRKTPLTSPIKTDGVP